MPFQPTDKITMSVSPAVQLAPYQWLRPHVSLTRAAGDDVNKTIEDMSQDLRKLALHAATVELGLCDELAAAITQGDLTTYLQKAVNNESITQEITDVGIGIAITRATGKETNTVRKVSKARKA